VANNRAANSNPPEALCQIVRPVLIARFPSTRKILTGRAVAQTVLGFALTGSSLRAGFWKLQKARQLPHPPRATGWFMSPK
jgi:hypothetical protein